MSDLHSNTVPALFSRTAEQYANRPALIDETGEELSYRQLDALRVRAARALLASGAEPGDRVAIWAQNCVEWAVAGLAIHTIGAAVVPINTRMRGPEVAYILKKSGARLLFSAGEFLGQHYPTLLGEHRPEHLREIIVLRYAQPQDTSWQAFLERASQESDARVRELEAAITPETCLDILFTSGTTGAPKGVITNHGQNVRHSEQWLDRMAITPEDRYLVVNPFFHSFGYKVGWLGGLLRGCAILPHAVFDADTVMQRIDDDRISVLPGPPTLFIGLLDHKGERGYSLSTLRATITGAAAVAPALVERIRAELGFDIVLTGYGQTETCGTISLCHPDDDAETIVHTVGAPIPDTEVRIVDTASGETLPNGQAGEIVFRGYNVMQGYLDAPEETAKTIDPNGWLHTGDIGYLDERGYIRITDRLKDMYITGGFNCYPAEIENMLSGHPAIAQVAVIGVPDERMGEVGKAYVVPRRGQTIDPEELTAWCRENMANYKVPRQIEIRDELPQNASGKVMKFKLREQELG